MAAEIPEAFSFCWLVVIITVCIILLLHHALKIYLHHGFHKDTVVTDSLSLLLISLAIIGLTVFIVTIIIPPDHVFCRFAAHYKASGYSLFKANLYSILILRCDTAFKASSVEYARWKLELWALILLFWSLVNVAGINLTATNITGTCTAVQPPLAIIVSIGLLGVMYIHSFARSFGLHTRFRMNMHCIPTAPHHNRPRIVRREHCFVLSAALQVAPQHGVESVLSLCPRLESPGTFAEGTGHETVHFITDRRLFHHVLADRIGHIQGVLHYDERRLFGGFAVCHIDVFVERPVARERVLLRWMWWPRWNFVELKNNENVQGTLCAVPLRRHCQLETGRISAVSAFGAFSIGGAAALFCGSALGSVDVLHAFCTIIQFEPIGSFGCAQRGGSWWALD